MKVTRHYAVVNSDGVPVEGNFSWVETTEGEQRDSLEYAVTASGAVTLSYKRYFDASDKGAVEEEMRQTVDAFRATYPAPKKESK